MNPLRNLASADLSLLRSLTRPSRFRHCLAVAAECAVLAMRFGLDAREASRMGLLHDLARDLDGDTLCELARSARTPAYPVEFDQNLILLHAPCAVRLIRERLHPVSPAAEQAIIHHPVGDPGAGPLSLVLQIADLTSRDRDWGEAETLRLAVEQCDTLRDAARLVLRRKAAYQESAGRELLDVTRASLKALEEKGPGGSGVRD